MDNLKFCAGCNQNKKLIEFGKDSSKKDLLRTRCKKCISLTNKKYRTKNIEQIKSYLVDYYQKHKETIKNNVKEYQKANWKNVNEKKKIYHKERRQRDPLYKLVGNIRHRTNIALKTGNFSKEAKFIQYIGCSLPLLRLHLELQFPPGVNWDNLYDLCEIDHITPLCSATTEEEVYNLCNYKNLRPLLKADHYEKSKQDRLIYSKKKR
jgi:hypothetical protein